MIYIQFTWKIGTNKTVTGYPVIEKAGYPAKYLAKELHLNTAFAILQSFDFK